MATQRLKIVVKSLNGFINKLAKGIVLDTVANLVRNPAEGGTPVDTGWARSNWIPHIGAPNRAPSGTRESVSFGPQGSALAAIAATYRISQGAVFISNNVPYITKLNMGTSRQAPAGFVERAITKAVTTDLIRNLRSL